MIFKLKRSLTLVALAMLAAAVIAGAFSDDASARTQKQAKQVADAPPPPPAATGYFGQLPIELDFAQAQAWSLERPYYRYFMYDYCDYRNCTLRWDGTAWTPSWYGPIN